MAAPAVAARGARDGVVLDDGYQSLVVFSEDTSLNIWEKTVQPPTMEGGDPIVTTTMANSTYETKRAQCLVDHDDAVVVAAYDPGDLSVLEAMINVEQAITFLYPDGSAFAVWGYLRRAEPSPLTKGEQPEITLTIVVTNWDPVNCVEAGPTFVDGTGSCICA